MGDAGKEFDERVTTLLTRGEAVLEGLRSVAKEAGNSQEALLRDARPHFDEVDAVVEKLRMGGVVRPALDYLASAWLRVMQREVRFYELLTELELIHEELFAVLSRGEN